MGNLGPPSGNPSSRRPFQGGELRGTSNGSPVTQQKEFLFDTGAEISAIDPDNAAHFDLTPTGGGAQGAGGGALSVYSGVTMRFKRRNRNDVEEWVECSLDFAVVQRNYSIIGVDQLSETGTEIDWNPTERTGELYEPGAPKKENGGWL